MPESPKYKNWKVVTEADFVSLFIKTWFAYISTLRVMFPEAQNRRGDGKYINAYKSYYKKDGRKQVISELLGCKPIFIDSADFSAQSRPRYYWTNIPVINWLQSKQVLKDIMQSNAEEKYFYSCTFDEPDMKKQVCTNLHIKGHDILKRVLNPDFKCHMLTTCGGGNTQKKVMDGGRPRKLTPLEYERLQTLSDNYTDGVSNTARYTAIGNGWTVDVIAHILGGLRDE